MHGLRLSIPGVSTLTQMTSTDNSPVEVRSLRLDNFDGSRSRQECQ